MTYILQPYPPEDDVNLVSSTPGMYTAAQEAVGRLQAAQEEVAQGDDFTGRRNRPVKVVGASLALNF